MVSITTMQLILAGVIVLVMGIVLGLLFGVTILNRVKIVGTFTINHSDPATDFCTLHLDQDIDVIEKRKAIGLEVQVK